RAASAADVVAAVPSDVGVLTSSLYNPVVDGVVLPAQPEAALRAGDAAAVPLIVGANADETGKEAPLTLTQTAYEDLVHAQFGPALGDQILAEYAAVSPPRAAYVALTSDARFICPSREIARSATTGAGTARRYLFRYAPGAVGAVHGLELPYVFGTFDAVVVPGGGTYTPTATDLALSARLQRMWTRFARTGDPGADPDPAWPAWDDGDPVMVLDDPTAVEAGAGAAHCDFWRPLYEAL
ncbi:MAG: carboxylesterase family protein, partial [Myxococcales bacterium]|nr:carboxylesterase family protein [Myxococcales bacterium]